MASANGVKGGGRIEGLERHIEHVLTAGLLLSTGLLLVGLLLSSPVLLRWGIVLLMLTPVVRVLVLTIALAFERDWVFTLVSLFVLGVLGSGMVVALLHR